MQNGFSETAFIEAYANAFEARDASRVTDFYHIPCLSVRADGSVHTFSYVVDIKSFFAKVLDAYAQEGMAKFTVANVECDAMGNAAVCLVCSWSMRRSDDSVIREWRQSYIFQRSASDWKIIASVFHL